MIERRRSRLVIQATDEMERPERFERELIPAGILKEATFERRRDLKGQGGPGRDVLHGAGARVGKCFGSGDDDDH